MEKSILIFNEYYLPGYKAGGPIRSISNLVSWLGDEFVFKIITKDRDSFEEQAYEGIKVNDWNRVEQAVAYYMRKEGIGMNHIFKLLKNTEYDAVYLNSFFNIWFSFFPLLLLAWGIGFNKKKILLAPRGELSEGALDQKTAKKKMFIWLVKVLGIHKKINWQATNEEEKKEIKKRIGVSTERIHIASNLPPKINEQTVAKVDKEAGELKMVYLSRVTPKKNLYYALNVLKQIRKKNIAYDIYGIIDDQKYWAKCKNIIESLPVNVTVRYKGVIDHKKVLPTLANYHVFFFPTKGENFGHAIYEAMIAGTPVLISNKTPWRNLQEKKLGWDYALDKKEKFAQTITELTKLAKKEINDQKKTVRESILKRDITRNVRNTKEILERLA